MTVTNDDRCNSCTFWHQVVPTNRLMNSLDSSISKFGKCKSPKVHYGYAFATSDDETGFVIYDQNANVPKGGTLPLIEVKTDNVLIENDEGWGGFFGRDFGCIHHAKKEVLVK